MTSNVLTKFAEQVPVKKLSCATEEATKHSLILPVIQMLGYDIFDPTEVVPEVDCDLKQTGERIDYIIERAGVHELLIECKHWKQNLDRHVMQLRAYFAASDARVGILTNGIEYRFYTDLEKVNLMDEEPFLVVDMEHLTDEGVAWLRLFRKGVYNAVKVADRALQQRRMEKLRRLVASELSNPSDAFVKHFAKQIFPGTITAKQVEQIRPLLTGAIGEYVGHPTEVATDDVSQNPLLAIVQDVLKDIVPAQRVVWVDNQQYSTVRLDGNEWSPICRIKFTEWAKWMAVTHWNGEKISQGEKHTLTTQTDIYNYAAEIQNIVRQMLTWEVHKDWKPTN